METITVQDIGPVETLEIPVTPGVVVLRGPNDCGKSETLKAMSRLAGGTEAITKRDRAASGSIEGLGVKITVRQSPRRSGQLEALSIEGRLSVADLVDPKIKDPAAADRQRIKALLQLTGVQADFSLFSKALGSAADHVQLDSLKTDDLVEMAARVKRDLEAASREESAKAEKLEAKAFACKQSAGEVANETPESADVLQARLEDALYAQGELSAKARSAAEVRDRAALARQRMEREGEQTDIASLEADVVAASRTVADAKSNVTAARCALAQAQEQLRRAEEELRVAADAELSARKILSVEKAHAETIAGWRETIAAAESVECPTADEIAAAAASVTSAREAIEKAAVARAAQAKAAEARKLSDEAKAIRRKADLLRDAARSTDDILSAAVASDSLTVKNGRLVTMHPERGEVFYADRSDGTRWKFAIDEAIKRIRQLGAEQTAIIPLPQAAWLELDPANKAAIHDYAAKLGVTIITAEAANGELRAEEFGGGS